MDSFPRRAWERSVVATEQGISGRFDGLFFRPQFVEMHISKTHNQMNKYDLWIYKSAGKVTPSKRDRNPRIASNA